MDPTVNSFHNWQYTKHNLPTHSAKLANRPPSRIMKLISSCIRQITIRNLNPIEINVVADQTVIIEFKALQMQENFICNSFERLIRIRDRLIGKTVLECK